MNVPDENAPTLPNRPVPAVPPQRRGSGPVSDEDSTSGKPPRWNVPPAPKAPGVATPNLQSFGIGFGIALVVLALMALGLALFLAFNGAPTTSAVAQATATATTKPGEPSPTP